MPTAKLAVSPSTSAGKGSRAEVTKAQLQESARYAVLRRMGSALRHQIAGSLQPVSMIASMVERRTQMDEPNIVALRKNCTEMSALSRAASSECIALMGWLAPLEGELVPIDAGVQDCLHLLATEFSFRGFAIANDVEASELLIARTAIRTVLPAALMALSDAASRPMQLQLSIQVTTPWITLAIGVRATDDERLVEQTARYRPLSWNEVELLAEAESVDITTQADGGVKLMFQTHQAPGRDKRADVRWE